MSKRWDRVVVAKCEDCSKVTTAIHTRESPLTGPGSVNCHACGGSLEEIESLRGEVTAASPLVDETPLAGILLHVLLESDGEMSQEELIATVDRSDHLVRRAIQRLEEEGQIIRETSAGEWDVRLARAETEVSAAADGLREK